MSMTAPAEVRTRLPMAEVFFAGAIASHSLAHAYVLKGKSYGAMYQLILKIAQVLNCKNPPDRNLSGNHSGEHIMPQSGAGSPPLLSDLACGQCTDCRWIAQNTHPAVLTVSRLTYQVEDPKSDHDLPRFLTPDELESMAKNAKWPKLIKTHQVGLLIHQLGIRSDYNRVVIFTDAEELPASFPSDVPAPGDWRSLEATEDRTFHIRPLDRQLFNASSVNKFLKTLEEPPPNTLFFYIAETEEQLLDTIVSRCQVVPCIAEGFAGGDSGEAGDVLANFPPEYLVFVGDFLEKLRQGHDVYALAREFDAFFIEQGGFSHLQALDVFQGFLRQRFLETSCDENAFALYRSRQQALDTARRMLEAKTNEGQSLLNLFLALSK